MQPVRSVLYLPASNPKALAKAPTLPTDAVILDLEDAVSPEQKSTARDMAVTALSQAFAPLTAVRINSLHSLWGMDDVQAVHASGAKVMVVPKVEQPEDIPDTTLPVWAMIETPKGVLNAENIAKDGRVQALVMGTSDLIADLRAKHLIQRENLYYALSRVVTCARAYGKTVLDGVHLDFKDLESFTQSCEQARNFGFDGKTLIHPSQIDIANRIFAPSVSEVEHAGQVLKAWHSKATGMGVAVLHGKLIENLHAAEAERILALHAHVTKSP